MTCERRGIILLATLFALLSYTSVASLAKTGPTHGKVVVCYISTWAVYRPGQPYSIENFDANLCTHAIYAFSGLDVKQSAIKSLDPWQDLKEDYGKGGYERLTGLKSTHPHLKVLLAIGGWNEGSVNYSIFAADPFQRGRFAKQASNFVRQYGFDGLDLDWEYPTQRGGQSHDRENFVLLTKELREEFDHHNLLLTSAFGAAKDVIDKAYDIPQLSRYLHFLHIMCYDYHGSWDSKIGYNSPLYAPAGDTLSAQFTIDYLIKLGAPPSKIVMGVPFYGRTFKTPLEGNHGDASEGVGFQGPYTREDGFLGFNELCGFLSNKSAGWTEVWDSQSCQMLARSDRDPFNAYKRVVTYDNSRSIANKVRFAMQKKLAGIMIWSVDTDDFTGACEPEENVFADFKDLKTQPLKRINNRYPLLRTVNEAMSLALEEIDADNNIVPNILDNEIPHGIYTDQKSAGASQGVTSVFFILLSTVFTIVWHKTS